MGIFYRPLDKLDFVKHINNVFTETGILDKQECYLLRDLNIIYSLTREKFSATKVIKKWPKL